MSNNLHAVNNSGFCSNFVNMVEQNNLSTLDPDCLGIDKIGRYTNNMKENLGTQPWTLKEIRNFLKFLKMNTLHSIIYTAVKNFSERRNLVKFKISNHKLIMELERYQIDHMTRKNKLYPLCKSKQIEDENHFLFQC